MNDQKIPVKQFIDPNTLKVPSKKAATPELTPEAAISNNPQPSNPPPKTLSNKPLEDWRGSLTTFKGFTSTRPDKEYSDLSWEDVKNRICPEKPVLLTDKKQGEYFVPCLLKKAPLVGITLEIAKSQGAATTDKMRSKSHVTEASMLVMDVDGLPEAAFDTGLDKIKNDGISYLAHSTFSHGNPAKPGMRVRSVMPIDRAVGLEEYAAVWHGFDSLYWNGQVGRADPSGAYLYQQQGTWYCNKTRQDQAFKLSNDAGVASADALIAIGRETQPVKDLSARAKQHNAKNNETITKYPPSDANKVADECNQIGLFRDKKGAGQSETLWRDCIGGVVYCENGAEFCQKWSSGYAGYSETETAEKLARRMEFPPTICNQFRKTNPEGCKGCTQTCHSPITLGWQVDTFKVIEDTASDINVVSNSEPAATATQQDDKTLVAKFARMPPMEYDRIRHKMARALGVQLSTLDVLVKAARNEDDESGDLLFPDVEPWPDPVDPAQLLDEIVNVIRRFIILDLEQAVAVALWIALTWFVAYVYVLALLIIDAPEKSCAKTLLLDLVGLMSARALPSSNISTAALFRAIERWGPTLLIDEIDTFIQGNNEITGVINAGHTRSLAFVVRAEGENYEPKKFSVWGAKALAGISLGKHLPDATMSRGIRINMRRKMPHESVTRLRHAEPGLFETIKSKLARFAIDYSQQVQMARPVLPEALSDRDQDNYEPLLAIAGCAGPEWVQRATAAALKLSSVSESSVSIGNELLADVQHIFESKRVDKISTVDLLEALSEDPEMPWSTYNRGNPLSARQLGKLLSPYGIKSKTVRQKFGTPKGYDAAQFKDAWARYLATPENLPPQFNDSATQDESGDLDDQDPSGGIY